MKTLIALLLMQVLLLLQMSPAFSQQQSYSLLIVLKYHPETSALSLERIDLARGESVTHLEQPEDGYTLKVLSLTKKELYTTKFIIPRPPGGSPPKPEWIDPKTGEQIYIPELNEPTDLPKFEEVIFSIVVPYVSRDINIAEIYNPQNKKILTINIPTPEELIDQMLDREEQEFIEEERFLDEPLTISEILILATTLLIVLGVPILVFIIVRRRRKRLTAVSSNDSQNLQS